jgi:ribosomal protein S18 acetylase RimI-like enzyme
LSLGQGLVGSSRSSAPRHRGEELAALLEQRLANITGPAYLESSNQRDLPLYERFGFKVIQELSLPDGGPTLWTMLRR